MWTYNYELYHHGVKGMRWGVRRYQNKDGTLTPEGQKARQKLSDAETSYNNARRASRGSATKREKYVNSQKASTAYGKMTAAKAAVAGLKAEGKGRSAQQAELKMYAREMSRNRIFRQRNTNAIYNEVKTTKGKAFADAALRRSRRLTVAEIAGGVAVGTAVAYAARAAGKRLGMNYLFN